MAEEFRLIGSITSAGVSWPPVPYSSFFISELAEAVIIASIGATAFIVFAMPDSITAQPRNCHRRANGRPILRLFIFINLCSCINIVGFYLFTCRRSFHLYNGCYGHRAPTSSWHSFGSRDHRHKIRCVNHRSC